MKEDYDLIKRDAVLAVVRSVEMGEIPFAILQDIIKKIPSVKFKGENNDSSVKYARQRQSAGSHR